MIGRRSVLLVGVVGATVLLPLGWATLGQTVPVAPVGPTRFEFLVVESFDARYLGDTPGHLGRGASGRVAPRLALGDLVHRGTAKVGTVTSLVWNEARESLEVEFSPEPYLRISIGDPVWVAVPGEKAH